MKMIVAIIRPDKFEDVQAALVDERFVKHVAFHVGQRIDQPRALVDAPVIAIDVLAHDTARRKPAGSRRLPSQASSAALFICRRRSSSQASAPPPKLFIARVWR